MKRWHEDYLATKNEWKKHHDFHVDNNANGIGRAGRIGVSAEVVDCHCDEQIGRFRKRKAFGCGKVHCGICKSHKYPKRMKTDKEIVSELDFKEQIRDM